jgi:hypothetical protein
MTANNSGKLDAILESIKNLEVRVSRIEANGAASSRDEKTAPRTMAKKLSIKEFLLQHQPATDIQRTLAIGYFLENHTGLACFTRAELEKGYRDAKEPLPSNISVNIAHCIKHGHMMDGEEKKNNKATYVITRSGEQFILAEYKKPKDRN